MVRVRTVFALVLLGAVLAGCGEDSAPTQVTPQASERPHAQLVLEPAASKPVVTFKGEVNGGRPLAADLASFDALPQHTLTVMEPFVKQSMTFTGVSFGDVLSAAHATGTSVTVHALDDYEATLDVAVLSEAGVMLATQVDGKAIDVTSGGPVRLVFPPSSKEGEDSDLWVWSIDQITVE